MKALILLDHDRGVPAEVSTQAIAFGAALGFEIEPVVIGDGGRQVASSLRVDGVKVCHVVEHPELTDYTPEGWADSLAQLMVVSGVKAVFTTGTDRGNEVMAHLGAILDQPMVANVIEATIGDVWNLKRVRWGGSLFEHVELHAAFALVTVAPHTWETPVGEGEPVKEVVAFAPSLDSQVARTRVVDRVT